MAASNGRAPTYVWTEYLRHRAASRGFALGIIEQIIRFSWERYFDTWTRRKVVIGRHGNQLVLVPYEQDGDVVIPITIHSTTRQQINFYVLTGRFVP